MKAFYEEYKDDEEFLQLVAKLSWKHNIILCQNKSDKIVDYTLKYINKPVGVSEYKIFEQLTKEIKKNYLLTKILIYI